MRIAICDDDKNCNDKLYGMLKNYMRYKNIEGVEIEVCASGVELLGKHGTFDFVFLDVEMPGMDGFEVAGRIREVDFDVGIVFVTNLGEYMRAGFRYNARDYLCKPVVQEEINELMERAIKERTIKNDRGIYSFKSKDGGNILLSLAEVLYFESRDKYVDAVTDKKTYTSTSQLSKIATDLDNKGFIRIHQSYLVNISKIFKDFGDHLVLKGGKKLNISKKYKGSVKEILKGMC